MILKDNMRILSASLQELDGQARVLRAFGMMGIVISHQAKSAMVLKV